MNSLSPVSSLPCPRCGRPSTRAFDATGICVRCAGAQIFSQTLTDRASSAPPIPTADNASGPARIGPYVIISELGRGGMGVVYLAQHTQLGRIVALKVIPSASGATSDLEMRFLREARTIARLDHPHIVTVHDAGRVPGQAYFSMDYFEDGDLARRLRTQPFTPREAAALMHQVTEAIAYSHAAGVLHRDLKPSNILLSPDGAHVADFGLAAELDASGGLTARTAVLGTPHYLAPEALHRGSSAQGAASDIYALGVILHEMLAGRTPFAGASPAELPSLLARNEAPALRVLAPQVPRDLATICAKCLEFDPSRRYATAADLAEDLRRFLAGESIKARPVSAGSQLLRWARRRPALAATWLLSFLLASASLTAAFLINRERLRGDREAAGSAALAQFFRKELLSPLSDGGERDRNISLRAVLDSSLEKIPRHFATAPLAEADLREWLASTYQSFGDYAQVEHQYRRAWELRQRHLGIRHPDTLRTAVGLADSLNSLGHSQEAGALLTPVSAELTRILGEGHPDSISALEAMSQIEQWLGQWTKAEALSAKALALARRYLAPDHELTGNALVNEATVLSLLGRDQEALDLCREDVAIAERVFGPDNALTLAKRVNVAAAQIMLGGEKEAAVTLRTLHERLSLQLGPHHPETLRSLGNLGSAYNKLNQYVAAEAVFTDLVAARTRVRGPLHPLTLGAKKHLAFAYGRNNKLDQGIVLMRELTDECAHSLGAAHVVTLANGRNLAAMLMTARRFDEALPVADSAYQGSLAHFGAEDINTLADEETLAIGMGFVGKDAEAEPHWRHVLAAFTRTQPDHWRTLVLRGQLGRNLARLHRDAEAEPLLRETYFAEMTRRAELSANRRSQPNVLAAQLALIYTRLDRPADAAEWNAKAALP